MKREIKIAATLLAGLLASSAAAQQSNSGPPRGFDRGPVAAFPARPKAPADVLARGKAAYDTNCASCHGADARGGERGGNNLLRSDITMKDSDGSLLRQFLLNPTGAEHTGVREGPQKFDLSAQQAADISAYIRNFPLSSRDPGRMRPPTIVVGDAKAGEAYFGAKCGSCHSATGDLKGVAARISDARTLQQTWLMPILPGRAGGARAAAHPVTVTVTQPDGTKVEGTLGRIDDFIVTLTEADGTNRSFRRDGDVPKVELHDPMQQHRDLLSVYTDRDIHNVTAYLATLK
ncbi:MAG TPA: c-type cytochrome [Bryobacteraceae bacterium]|nr:c-type cytochrome [Bryobacteraceae bacterium]